MTQQLAIGLGLVLAAGFLQGSFMLPNDAHAPLAVGTQLGDVLPAWDDAVQLALAACTVPDLFSVYRATPAGDLVRAWLFGVLWGAGAILFGLGMDRLGMAVGYPIIMGLILSLGAIIPLLLQSPAGSGFPDRTVAAGRHGRDDRRRRPLLAGGRGQGCPAERPGAQAAGSGLGAGLVIAMLAGMFSCFPNVGMNYAENLKAAAVEFGASPDMAGNAAWALMFTAGFVLNFGYCLGLMLRRGNLGAIGQRLRTKPGLDRPDGRHVDRQLLPLRHGRGADGQMGRHRRLAAVHLAGHPRGQPLGPVARRMAHRRAVGPRRLNRRTRRVARGRGRVRRRQRLEGPRSTCV